jgi:cytochrome c oxidase assembly protein subunit 15
LPVATRGALVGILLLGALQGYMGWYMVKSGLVDMPRVSPFRLAAHLGLALIIYAWMFRLGIGLLWPRSTHISPLDAALRGFCNGLTLLLAVTIVYGAFVAGHRAGYGFNTFPLMNGKWVPDGLWALQPGWRNLLENNITLQFAHRCLAIAVLLWVWCGWVSMRFRLTDRSQRVAFDVLAGTSLLQVALGIATLLAVVPVGLGTLHQGGAVLLLSSLLLLSSRCRQLSLGCVLQSEARSAVAGVQYASVGHGEQLRVR